MGAHHLNNLFLSGTKTAAVVVIEMVICVLNNIPPLELYIAVLAFQDVPVSLAKRKLYNPVLGWSVATLEDIVELDKSVWRKGGCYFASTTALDGSVLIL